MHKPQIEIKAITLKNCQKYDNDNEEEGHVKW